MTPITLLPGEIDKKMRQIAALESLAEQLRAEVQAMADTYYKATGDFNPHPHVTIKLDRVEKVERLDGISPSDLLKWVRENAPAGVKLIRTKEELDTAEFNNRVRRGELNCPLVEVREKTYTVSVGRKLGDLLITSKPITNGASS